MEFILPTIAIAVVFMVLSALIGVTIALVTEKDILAVVSTIIILCLALSTALMESKHKTERIKQLELLLSAKDVLLEDIQNRAVEAGLGIYQETVVQTRKEFKFINEQQAEKNN